MSATPELRVIGKNIYEVKENLRRIFDWARDEETMVNVVVSANLPSVYKSLKDIYKELETTAYEDWLQELGAEARKTKSKFDAFLDEMRTDMFEENKVKKSFPKGRFIPTNVTPKKKKRK